MSSDTFSVDPAALALGAAVLATSSMALAAGEPKLLVYLHVTIKQRAFQSELEAALPGIAVTAVGRIADFVRGLADVQDAVLTLPVVLAAHGMVAKLKGARNNSTEERYSLVNAGAPIDAAQLAAVGALDLLGREGTNDFVHGLLEAKPKVERVTKVEDLLALLQMQRVQGIVLPSRLFAEIQKGSRLALTSRELKLPVGLPALDIVGPGGAQVVAAIGKLPPHVKRELGVDEWR